MWGNRRLKFAHKLSPIPVATIEHIKTPIFDLMRQFRTPDDELFIKSKVLSNDDVLLNELVISRDMLFIITNVLSKSFFQPVAEIPLINAFIALCESKHYDLTELVKDLAWISENLFHPLPNILPSGKNYKRKERHNSSQQTLFGDFSDDSGIRQVSKAWSREKSSRNSYTINRLNIWDLIFPILSPPLDLNFIEEIDFPEGCSPYPYQRTGIEFLIEHPEALLADETGTGKTVMASVALRILFHQGKVKKCLVVCPPVALNVWDDHLFRWAPELRVTVVRGTPEVREYDWKYPAHIYLTTYETLRSDLSSEIKRKKLFKCPDCATQLQFPQKVDLSDAVFPEYKCPKCNAPLDIEDLPLKMSLLSRDSLKEINLVILDEAQRIKNPTSQRSRAVKKTNPKWRWALTATPLENKLEDIVSIFEFIKPGYIRKDNLTTDLVKGLIKPYTLRRTKKEVKPEMPEKIHSEIWLDLDGEQRSIYNAWEARERKRLEEIGAKVTKMDIFAVIQKLKQICNFHPENKLSPKTEALLEKIEEIADQGKKVLVFSQYKQEGCEKLADLFNRKNFKYVYYKGGMSDAQRKRAEETFKSKDDVPIFLGVLAAAGESLNLQVAKYVIHFDHWWNPARMWQAEDRAYRINSDETVNVYNLWVKDTIEARIHKKLKEKGLLFQKVMGGLSEEIIDEFITIDEWLEIIGVKSINKTKKEPSKKPLIDNIYDMLTNLDPLKFEEIVKQLFYKLGYQNAKTTKKSHDGGIDIVASRLIAGGTEKAIVQCKRTAKIGVDYARALLGVVAADQSISKAYLVTSGIASNECKLFCDRDGRLVLMEGPMLANYIKQFEIKLT